MRNASSPRISIRSARRLNLSAIASLSIRFPSMLFLSLLMRFMHNALSFLQYSFTEKLLTGERSVEAVEGKADDDGQRENGRARIPTGKICRHRPEEAQAEEEMPGDGRQQTEASRRHGQKGRDNQIRDNQVPRDGEEQHLKRE